MNGSIATSGEVPKTTWTGFEKSDAYEYTHPSVNMTKKQPAVVRMRSILAQSAMNAADLTDYGFWTRNE
jgi:hypothetical protein